ncbi:prepilin-type N-terminal cleavage/methylation domain-containing protein [Sulfurimonas aquatica]|uniref:Prepilin-type N-terminal cleavage/methylation domain-containing protein n=1 Tax=Sulfurimonas aquatica TaxID=2672570 RepID=A0A975AYI2_9BACT|nr:type II secretion system protein [Sulfurimonas aquatica]QSZ40889.1 prepilin-type N-terminal cleavage/methylation domain-containing protein [Sulfurimonas aquatica]
MKNYRYAFTMVELVMVIVVIGILTAIALPKFAAMSEEAAISKGRSDIASIRSGIITERQARLIKGDPSYISGTALNTGGLFAGILNYPIPASTDSSHWNDTATSDATNTYNYNINGTNVGFTYTRSTGIFDCTDSTATYCEELTK